MATTGRPRAAGSGRQRSGRSRFRGAAFKIVLGYSSSLVSRRWCEFVVINSYCVEIGESGREYVHGMASANRGHVVLHT